jgi:hypothetical protein
LIGNEFVFNFYKIYFILLISDPFPEPSLSGCLHRIGARNSHMGVENVKEPGPNDKKAGFK